MHDAFVSYSHRDREWVMNTFVPGLCRAGLDVHTDQHFPKDVDPARSMAAAVLDSRCTVVVITRNWLTSDWGNFEGDVAVHADRLLSILREPCTLPPGVQEKICANFSDDARFDVEMELLIRLINRLIDTAARDGAAQQEEPFAATAERLEAFASEITVLSDLKAVQDQLHVLRVQCLDPIERDVKYLSGGDDLALDNLAFYADQVTSTIEELRHMTGKPSFQDVPARWLDWLEAAREQLDAGIIARDPAAIRRAAGKLERVLSVQVPAMGARANNATNALGIGVLTADVAGIWARALAADRDPRQLEQLQAAYREVRKVTAELESFRRDLDRWQSVEVDFDRLDNILTVNPIEFHAEWPDLKQSLGELAADGEWAKEIEKAVQSLDAALERQDTSAIPRWFGRLRFQIMRRFYSINRRIAQICDDLRRIGMPLTLFAKNDQ